MIKVRQNVFMHLMISRVEGIGDVCLTLPAIGYVKQLMPECKISMLVSPYSQAVARSCHWLDDVVVLEPNQPVSDIASFLSSLHISHFVHVTANKTLAKVLRYWSRLEFSSKCESACTVKLKVRPGGRAV